MNINAQTFKAGILGGISTSQVSGDGYGGFNKAGLNFGAFVNTDIGEKMKAQFEIEYMQKGSRKNPDSGAAVVDLLILRMDYIQVPVMVKYFHKSFYLEGGLYAGILINFYLEDETGLRDPDEALLQGVKTSDFGYLGGLGYSFAEHYSFNTRFSQSLGNVKEHPSGAARWLDSGWRHVVVSFTFRYTF